MPANELALRYGCNPHQTPARVHRDGGPLPFEVLNGSPGYINLLDAFNSWQLVRELKQALGQPAAASFKHVSPAGAAVAVPMSEDLRRASFVDDLDLSPAALAYARARGADRLSSYGDWVALSEPVDISVARLIRRETSDGIIAPAYDPEAVEILSKKKKGNYPILRIDPDYSPPENESREVFGITMEQRRNDRVPGPDLFERVVTERKDLPDSAQRDLLVATIALKYTQSNSVCFALDGQVIGLGAGQQNRVACVDLAAGKAARWYLRQHPDALALPFQRGLNRAEKINVIEGYIAGDMTPTEQAAWEASLQQATEPMSGNRKREWLDGLSGVSISSDAFFPFRDNIDRAARMGVKYVLQPGGSIRDDDVIAAADDYGMTMCFSGLRLFHH